MPIGNHGHSVLWFDQNHPIIIDTHVLNQTNNITIEAWIKPQSVEGSSHQQNRKNNKRLQLKIRDDGQAEVIFGTTGWSAGVSPVEVNQWLYVSKRITISDYDSSKFNQLELEISGYASSDSKQFESFIAEVRIWNKDRSPEEIQADMYRCLTGKEEGLVAYYPMDKLIPDQDNLTILERVNHKKVKVPNGLATLKDDTFPLGGDAVVCAEYSTVGIDPKTKQKSALMRRFLAYPGVDGATLLTDKRIEELELRWIGNGQFAPTLLGYIEGSPPIPSENLTEGEDYNGATSVELTMSRDMDYSWNRDQDASLGATADIFAGAETEAEAGLGLVVRLAMMRLGFKGNLDFSYNWQNQSSISSSHSLRLTDRLELRGTPEHSAKFSRLGERFIPKNVGYALVVSCLADTFITRLKRSKRMVAYEVRPVEGIPPDVNTLSFLINPAYTMNGSLDGLTGSEPTSTRFFHHVPTMRAQYGSLYPASYYRLKEAYDLKEAIEEADKKRESYFANFNVGLVDETSLNREIDSGEEPQAIGIEENESEVDDDALSKDERERREKERQERQKKELKKQAKDSQTQKEKETNAKRDEIKKRISDSEQRTHALTSFASWQKKMENIQIRAGKRNIVNTYVWDVNGGLHTEAQSFATTTEHTIGGSFNLEAGLGVETEIGAAVAKV